MARDREILSDKEMMRSVLDIVEYLTQSHITLTTYEGDNYVKLDANSKFTMNIASPAVKNIDKYTAFAHECGHILGHSPIQIAQGLIKSWCTDADTFMARVRYEMYWNSFNVLEDQRIEYIIGRMWRLNKQRFEKTRQKIGTTMNTANNPVQELLSARFYREDLVKSKRKKDIISAIKNVEGTGSRGALRILGIIKPILDEWFDEQKNMKDIKGLNNIDNPNTTSETDMAEVLVSSAKIKETNKEELDEEIKKMQSEIDKSSDITKEKKDLEAQFESFEKKLAEIEKPQMRREFVSIPRQGYAERYENYEHIEKSLKGLLKKINERYAEKIDYIGEEVDVETYVENKAQKKDVTRSMRNKKIDKGLSIVLAIDCSGSMTKYERINKAKSLVYTIYKAVENNPRVNVKAIMWASSAKGKVGITEIDSIKSINKIRVADGYMLTPTHLALEYSADALNKMKGRKKLLIMITDGIPEYKSNNFAIPLGNLIKMTKKSLQYARRLVPDVAVFLVGVQGNYRVTQPKKIMKDIFGNRVVVCNDMNSAVENVIKQMKQVIVRSLY